ncbi:flavin monoamine oxidase family protein [Cyclobacterium xiamenense]|jgi:monoamine oxidase|uniref:flavin monoamine oxidase family protein n=1 Tax=Cyclobacterium xiamenense TaxID=1297121 RepID=UPI0035D113BD
MKRRDFLQATALLGGALTLPTKGYPSLLTGRQPKHVLVIGAGFSGLAAAYKLKKAGIKTTVLEARNRVGGRVFSHQPIKGETQTIELGAEWVGASHERVIELCREFGLELFDNRFETDLIYRGNHAKAGTWQFSPEMEAFWAQKTRYWEKLSAREKQKMDRMDWWRFLSRKGFTDRDIDLRELLDSTDFGESIRKVSSYSALAEYAESSEKNEMDLKIKGGNDLLAKKMAQAIGETSLHLGRKVSRVEQSNGGVTVRCVNGEVFQADQLICTAPTYMVLKIDWQPALPPDLSEALHALQYARIGKFPIVFSERFWGRENFDCITDSVGHYFYHGTKDQAGTKGVLVAYAIGDKAEVLHAQPKPARLQLILDSLRPAFGDLRSLVSGETSYYWGKDEYSYGAYAQYGVGQWFDVMPVLKKRFQAVHFAGEHLAEWQGFMEGAINSGEEVVEKILS